MRVTSALCFALSLAGLGCASGAAGPRVVLVTLDGVRWQEVFRGDDPALGGQAGSSSGEERRRGLMPFLWGTLARQGQIFGNADRGSRVTVANPFRISYPGYHELLCGFSSPVIRSNLRLPNPDVTVLEWLNRRPGFTGSVAAYTSWDAFAAILNPARSGLPVDVGTTPARPTQFQRLRAEARPPWKDSVYDAFVFHAAMEYLEKNEPRVLYIALGDTDEWAHAGNYERYLDAIRRSDRWLAELWEKLSTAPRLQGPHLLVITTDHGRGDGPEAWGKHDPEVPGAEAVWIAVIGPQTARAGRTNGPRPADVEPGGRDGGHAGRGGFRRGGTTGRSPTASGARGED